jgi:lipopolysaccharide/colanic/teichoic acid biosynthesis glycosyltransferase
MPGTARRDAGDSATAALVGLRPHAMQARAEDRLCNEVVNGYLARHKVKPGIAG